MNSLSLAFVPVLLVLSCGDKNSTVHDTDNGSSPDGQLLLGGDAGFLEIAESCEDYDRVDVSGSVRLDSSKAPDLSSVACLGSISGNLTIEGEGLIDIDLPNIDQIGGDLVVSSMSSLETLRMDALMSVGGSIQVESNEYLQVASWHEICDVGAAIVIRENTVLVELDLAMLTGVNTFEANARSQSGSKTAGIFIETNSSLQRLELPMLMGMDTDLKIYDNEVLESINIEKASQVGGNLTIMDNPVLVTLDFSQLGAVYGTLWLSNNPLLNSRAEDFPLLQRIEGDLLLEELRSYYEPSFPSLLTVNGKVYFHTIGVAEESANQGEELMFSVGLPLLNTVAAEVIFTNLGARRLNMSSLMHAPFDVSFIDNPHLLSLELAASLSWNGNLILSGNPNLESLTAFNGLIFLGGRLDIKYNASLTSVSSIQGVNTLRAYDLEGKGDAACPDDETAILICGNPLLTYEHACETMEALTDALEYLVAYVYEGADCPETCPSEAQVYGQQEDQICHFNNLDDDGDGYSENEGDCDDDLSTGTATHPFAAEEEPNAAQCMTDSDGDGWGDCSPSDEVIIAGTDCDDNDALLNNFDNDSDGYSTCEGDCDDDNTDSSLLCIDHL